MRSLLVVVAMGLGCGEARRAPLVPHATKEQLAHGRISRAELASLARAPSRDVRQTLAIAVVDDVSGRGFEGRGAVAVRPRQALRMILLGPGGTTAMDVWIREGRFRVAIPSIGRVVRGDATTPRSTMRGLPIDFLTFWLIDPFGGKLVVARSGALDASNALIDDPHGFVAWMRRGPFLEVRARDAGLREQGFWIARGKLVAKLDGALRTVDGTDGALFPAIVRYKSYDPPMTVHVNGEAPAAVDALPPSTFEDPDR